MIPSTLAALRAPTVLCSCACLLWIAPLLPLPIGADPTPENSPAARYDAANENIRHRAESLIRRLLQPAKLENTSLRMEPPKLIKQKPGQPWGNLPPVREVRFHIPDLGNGYLFLDNSEEMALEEFAFDLAQPVPPLQGGWVEGVPNLQQFPIPSPSGKGQTASGCVPTAGASVIGFWAAHSFPGWLRAKESPTAENATLPPTPEEWTASLQETTLRLRKQMQMLEIPDDAGYADKKMSLSGAGTADLARALQKDAQGRQLPFLARCEPFSVETLHREIAEGRPMLVDCVVRLPQKPELTWGHEVVAVGWQQVEDFEYVGVVDNFFPVQNAATVRWIEKRAFGSGIVVRPEEKARGAKTDQKNTR